MSDLTDGATLGARLRAGDLSAAPAALNLVENRSPASRVESANLLRETSPAAIGHDATGHLIGVTGPPGAGKSTLLSALVAAWRSDGRSVAVLAVDPSSKRSGGSLLGDRARIVVDPSDSEIFIRSTAAGEQLGGLAPATRAGAQALSVAFDVVVIETVGVGQSETDVADVVDTNVVVVQPGSGDVLQFLKSGIMETPDVLVVTKADLGQVALSARRDLSAALRSLGARQTEVISVSAIAPLSGIVKLIAAIDTHWAGADVGPRRLQARRRHALADFLAEHGASGLRALGGRRTAMAWLDEQEPGVDVPGLTALLEAQAAAGR